MKNPLCRPSQRTRPHEAGFTLIELVMVISLLGILAYLGISRMGDMSAYSLDGATQKIMADMRYAQSLATSTGDSYGFRATGATTYEVYKVSDGSFPTSPYSGLPMQEDFSQTFNGTQFGETVFPVYNVVFDDTGTPTTGGGTEIIIETTTTVSTAQQITVSTTSGLISAGDVVVASP